MLNTYTVQVTDHKDLPTREDEFFACVTHYPDAPDPHSVVEVTRTSTWGASEDEAVARALRDNKKERTIADGPDSAAAAELRVAIVDALSEPGPSATQSKGRAEALVALAESHRITRSGTDLGSRVLDAYLRHPESIRGWAAVIRVIHGHLQIRADFDDANSAVEYMTALTNGENLPVEVGNYGPDELPVEIVDLDHGRSLKAGVAFGRIAGRSREASSL